jgi:serine protease DegQ
MNFLKDFEDRIVSVVSETTQSVVSVIRGSKHGGAGSGVILSEDGYIVTNAHVIKGTGEVTVVLSDGCYVKARVVGTSNVKDIAILKTESRNLVPIKLGDPTEIKLGQFCLAIGNSLGMGTTVTFGMVSGLGRNLGHAELQFDDLIQTSAPINPGNSGGALLNLDGHLIGIPTVMILPAAGVGFAISVEDIHHIYNRFLETGDAKSPVLGVKTQSLTKIFAKEKKLGVHIGALVVGVSKGPAKTAGVRKMDVITRVDEQMVNTSDDLRNYIINLNNDQKVVVHLVRAGEVRELTITL